MNVRVHIDTMAFVNKPNKDEVTIAKMIDIQATSYWYKVLDGLKVGTAVAIGDLYIREKKRYLNTSIITKSKFGSK